MGFLSESAKRAYRSGARRPHVPEWFVPVSYGFAGLIALVLAYGVVFSDTPASERAGATITSVPEETSAPEGSTVPGLSNVPVDGGTTPEPGVPGETTAVFLLDGGEASVPAAAWTAAQSAVFALFTGDFADVSVYPGKTPPVLLTTWDEPSIVGLVFFAENPDGTVRFVIRVDPDTTGNEPARDVPVILAPFETRWAYLPG